MGRNGGTHPRFSRKIGGREDIFPCCGGPLLVHWRQEVIVMRFERETGRIFARDESGKLLAEACVDGEELLVHTIDLDEVASYRVREIVYLRDRRPETYDLLTNLY